MLVLLYNEFGITIGITFRPKSAKANQNGQKNGESYNSPMYLNFSRLTFYLPDFQCTKKGVILTPK